MDVPGNMNPNGSNADKRTSRYYDPFHASLGKRPLRLIQDLDRRHCA
jgi:predicted N-formylglutamate amidohydrolase